MTITERILEQTQNIQALVALWRSLLPEAPCPDNAQFGTWLDLHAAEDVLKAIKVTANKYNLLKGAMDQDYMVRYCSSCANQRKTDRDSRYKEVQP